MDTRKIKIEGVKKYFEYYGYEFCTNIDDVRDFIIHYIHGKYNVKLRDLFLLSKSMQIFTYKDSLKQKTIITVIFVEVESKANFNPLFSPINTYKVFINDLGFDMVKGAMHALEQKINN